MEEKNKALKFEDIISVELIKESARILTEQGVFIVSTPNRDVTNPGTYICEKPINNNYHQYEYNIVEFTGELLKEYEILNLYGQTFINTNKLFFTRKIREMRNLNPDYSPQDAKNTTAVGLMPIGEIKYAMPIYIVAVCRKKSK